MDREQALRILRLLSNGFDPSTGEELARDSICHRPDVLKALAFAAGYLEADQRLGTPQQGARRQGEAWTPEEDRQLLAAFEGGTSMRALAGIHGRSRGAIYSRLVKHGRVQPRGAADAATG